MKKRNTKNESSLTKLIGMFMWLALLVTAVCLPRAEMEAYELTALYILSSLGMLFQSFVAIGKIRHVSVHVRVLTLLMEVCALVLHVWVFIYPNLTLTGILGPIIVGGALVVIFILTLFVLSVGDIVSDAR